jgi:hypothetical protein
MRRDHAPIQNNVHSIGSGRRRDAPVERFGAKRPLRAIPVSVVGVFTPQARLVSELKHGAPRQRRGIVTQH